MHERGLVHRRGDDKVVYIRVGLEAGELLDVFDSNQKRLTANIYNDSPGRIPYRSVRTTPDSAPITFRATNRNGRQSTLVYTAERLSEAVVNGEVFREPNQE